jgi:hypothetical protein
LRLEPNPKAGHELNLVSARQQYIRMMQERAEPCAKIDVAYQFGSYVRIESNQTPTLFYRFSQRAYKGREWIRLAAALNR